MIYDILAEFSRLWPHFTTAYPSKYENSVTGNWLSAYSKRMSGYTTI